MPTIPPAVSTLPPAPVRGQPGFSAATGTFLEALPPWGDELQAAGEATHANAQEVYELTVDLEATALVAAEAAGLAVRSTSTLTVEADAHPIHFTAPKPLLAVLNKRLAVVLESDPTIRMIGSATTVTDSDDIILTVDTSGLSGAGEFSSWLVIDAAFLQPGATAEEILAGLSDAVAITPLGQKTAMATFALTDDATVTPDGQEGRMFSWTIGGNRTLGAIVNTYVNAPFEIEITQGGAGSNLLAYASGVYKRRGGPGVLSTTAGAVDLLSGRVKAVDGSGTCTRAVYDIIKAPSS